MSTTFGILTAVLLLLAALAALKNKQAYENEISHRQDREKELAENRERLRKTIDTLKATTEDLRSTESEVVTLTEEDGKLKKTNDELKASIESLKTETEANKVKLDGIKAKLAEIGDINTLVPEVKAIIAAINEAEAQIEADNAKLANLTSENNRIEAYIKKIRDEDVLRSKKQSYLASATIRAIYPDWGFVTIGAGSSAGIVAGSSLDVVRDGQTVAKLLVTGIENNTSQASIVPDSLVEGTTLMTGDKVVPSKTVAPAKPEAKIPQVAPDAAQPEGGVPDAGMPADPKPADAAPTDASNPFADAPAPAPAEDKPAEEKPAEANDSNPFAE